MVKVAVAAALAASLSSAAVAQDAVIRFRAQDDALLATSLCFAAKGKVVCIDGSGGRLRVTPSDADVDASARAFFETFFRQYGRCLAKPAS